MKSVAMRRFLTLLTTATALQQAWRVGEEVLGPRRVARALEVRRAGEARRCAALEAEHARLSDAIAKVLKHRRRIHTSAAELATMKKAKLRISDELAAAARAARRSRDARVLGAGACGEVYAASHAESGRAAAAKVARAPRARRMLRREFERLRAARVACGPGVVEPLAFLDRDDRACLVLARLGPSVDDLFWATTCGTGFSGGTVLRLAAPLVAAVADLSAAGLVHRDLKPANVLVDDGEPVLIDFGLCAERGAVGSSEETFAGTARFASANALRDGPAVPGDDLESLAYALAYLLCGTLPWSAESEATADDVIDEARALADQKDAVEPGDLVSGVRDDDPLFDVAAGVCADLLAEARRPEPDAARASASVAARLPRTPPPLDWVAAGVAWDAEGVLHLPGYDS